MQNNNQQNNNQQNNNQPQQNNMNYFFYSQNYCEHSKRAIQLMNKYDILNKIILCNIDNKNLKIPPFITSVPTLYLTTERRMINGRDLFEWISNNSNNDNNILSMIDVTGSDNIYAFQSNELGSNNDVGYSFIDNNLNNQMATSFEMLDGSNKENLNMPIFTRMNGMPNDNEPVQNTNNEKQMRQEELNKAYDDLMAARAAENNSLPINQRV
jgi:hypothetical protein